MEHTKEPWEFVEAIDNFSSARIVEDCISGSIKGDGWHIARVWGDNGAGYENARRIVACVNACAGIDTLSLEAGGIGWLQTACQLAYSQRDELLEALKRAVRLVDCDVIRVRPSDKHELLEALELWNKVIAKAEQS